MLNLCSTCDSPKDIGVAVAPISSFQEQEQHQPPPPPPPHCREMTLSSTSTTTPSKDLIERIRSRNWTHVREGIASHPIDAQYKLVGGNRSVALHLACLYRAPYDVVRDIIDAYPEGVSAQDNVGWTPLHVALLYGVDFETCVMLIRRSKAAVSVVSKLNVGSPLHVACRHGYPTQILAELLRIDSSMANVVNGNGNTPIAFLWQQYTRKAGNHSNTRALEGDGEFVNNEEAKTLMQSMTLLMRASEGFQAAAAADDDSGASKEDSWRILHSAISLKFVHKLPLFVSMILKVYPEQVKENGHIGRLPMHAEASTPPCINRDEDSLGLLVRAYPRAASIRNKTDGRLPLHTALDSKRTWRWGGIKELVAAAPETIEIPDPCTHMYPFMVAAHKADAKETKTRRRIEQLETIFELLLASPQLLSL